MPARSRHSRLVLRLISVIFTLTVVFTVILATEWILDKQKPLTFPFHNVLYPYVMFRPPSDTVWHSSGPSPSSRTGEVAIEYSNKDGLRIESSDYVLTPEKPHGQLRIAVIGGSTVRIGTQFEVTLPGSLKQRLKDQFPDTNIEIINAGIISAISRQELVYLITTLVDYDLDILIIYDGINDSGQMLYYERRPNFPYNYNVMERAWSQFTTDKTQPIWQTIINRSSILSRLLQNTKTHDSLINPLPAKDLINDKSLRTTYAKTHIENWYKIRQICKAYGIQPVFILQPTSLYGIFPNGVRKQHQNKLYHENLYANYLVYEEFRDSIQTFSRVNPSLNVLDLSSLLRADAFFDGAHVYDDVNDTIAEVLVQHLSDDIHKLTSTH